MSTFELIMAGFFGLFGSLKIAFKTKNLLFNKKDKNETFLVKYSNDIAGLLGGTWLISISIILYLENHENSREHSLGVTPLVCFIAFICYCFEKYFERKAPEKASNSFLNKNRVNSPCPECGKQLRTPQAQQCFNCGANWHK